MAWELGSSQGGLYGCCTASANGGHHQSYKIKPLRASMFHAKTGHFCHELYIVPGKFYTFGRSRSSCDIVFLDKRVSRHHCQVYLNPVSNQLLLLDGAPGIMLGNCAIASRNHLNSDCPGHWRSDEKMHGNASEVESMTSRVFGEDVVCKQGKRYRVVCYICGENSPRARIMDNNCLCGPKPEMNTAFLRETAIDLEERPNTSGRLRAGYSLNGLFVNGKKVGGRGVSILEPGARVSLVACTVGERPLDPNFGEAVGLIVEAENARNSSCLFCSPLTKDVRPRDDVLEPGKFPANILKALPLDSSRHVEKRRPRCRQFLDHGNETSFRIGKEVAVDALQDNCRLFDRTSAIHEYTMRRGHKRSASEIISSADIDIPPVISNHALQTGKDPGAFWKCKIKNANSETSNEESLAASRSRKQGRSVKEILELLKGHSDGKVYAADKKHTELPESQCVLQNQVDGLGAPVNVCCTDCQMMRVGVKGESQCSDGKGWLIIEEGQKETETQKHAPVIFEACRGASKPQLEPCNFKNPLKVSPGSTSSEKTMPENLAEGNLGLNGQCGFSLNRLEGEVLDSSGTVSLKELLSPLEGLLSIFIATFSSDIPWLVFSNSCWYPMFLSKHFNNV